MSPEIETLINDMMVKSRVFAKAITERDEALANTCKSDSKEDEVKWIAASEKADQLHRELAETIKLLHAAREKR